MQTRSLALGAALLALTSGCFRQVRPSLGGDRQVDTGVPVTLGSEHPDAPELTYDFGDGSPLEKGKLVRHAYAQPGRYRAFAIANGEPVDAVVFTAVPRRVTRALPEKTNGAVFFRQISGSLDVTIDWLEALLGSEAAQSFVESSPLIELGMELSASHSLKERGVDPEEGLGVFSIEGFPGTVALIGIIDGEKAVASLVQLITRGKTPAWSGNDGTTRARLTDGREAALLLDRGYLYLIVPDTPAPPDEWANALPDELARDSGMNKTDFSAAVNAVKGAHALGFEGTGVLQGLEDKVKPGSVYLYLSADKKLPPKEQGAFASFQLKSDQLDVDGFYRSKRPWGTRLTTSFKLLDAMPKGALAAFGLSVPPHELAQFVFGEKGSEQRQKANARARAAGVPFEELLDALTGDVCGAVYFDARAAFAAMAKADRPSPQFKGSLVARAGLNDVRAFDQLLMRLSDSSPAPFKRAELGSSIRYQATYEGQPLELRLGEGKLDLAGGEATAARGTEDLGQRLRTQFGDDAFGPGHLSLFVDVSQLRTELASVDELPGVPQGKVDMFKMFAGAMLQQFPPIEQVFLDVSSTEGGAKLRGRITLTKR